MNHATAHATVAKVQCLVDELAARVACLAPLLPELIDPSRLMDLGPGTPHTAVRDNLSLFKADALAGPKQPTDMSMARACLAGLWLLHDFLHESHEISQEISTTTGSYWHAILHRREPDADNARYWFRKIGEHAVVSRLRQAAASAGYRFSTPMDFVALCERVRGTATPEEMVAKSVQQLEWWLLFDFCASAALGTEPEPTVRGN